MNKNDIINEEKLKEFQLECYIAPYEVYSKDNCLYTMYQANHGKVYHIVDKEEVMQTKQLKLLYMKGE